MIGDDLEQPSKLRLSLRAPVCTLGFRSETRGRVSDLNPPLLGFTHECPSAVHPSASTPAPHCCGASACRCHATHVFRPRAFSAPRRLTPHLVCQFVAPGFRQGFATSASVHTDPKTCVPRHCRGAHPENPSHRWVYIAAYKSATFARLSQRNPAPKCLETHLRKNPPSLKRDDCRAPLRLASGPPRRDTDAEKRSRARQVNARAHDTEAPMVTCPYPTR